MVWSPLLNSTLVLVVSSYDVWHVPGEAGLDQDRVWINGASDLMMALIGE